MELEGKVAFVTGGCSGIGAATCRRFWGESARVATLSRTLSEVEESAEAVRRAGGVEPQDGNVPLTDGGPGTPEQVAGLVRFLSLGRSGHIAGTEVSIDGAESLLRVVRERSKSCSAPLAERPAESRPSRSRAGGPRAEPRGQAPPVARATDRSFGGGV